MVGVLIAEFFASSQGIGHRMMLLMSNFEINGFFVCLVVVCVITLTCAFLVQRLERLLQQSSPAPFGASG